MKYRLPTLDTRYRNGSMYRLLSVCLLIISTHSIQANEPSSSLVQRRLTIGAKEVSVALSENARDLVVTVPNSKPLDLTFQRKRVTSFQVADWLNAAGVVIVAEVREGKNEYSYHWA